MLNLLRGLPLQLGKLEVGCADIRGEDVICWVVLLRLLPSAVPKVKCAVPRAFASAAASFPPSSETSTTPSSGMTTRVRFLHVSEATQPNAMAQAELVTNS
eukprot:5807021-Prymnesium_polylepis.2